MKALSADSLLARLLGRLTAAVIRYPRWFIYPQALLFVICVLYTIGYLKADMNRDHLVGPNHKNQQNYLRLQKEFPFQGNDLVVVVESGNIELNRQYVERIAAKMQAETNLFADIFYQQDPSVMGARALLFATTNDLVALKGQLDDALPVLGHFTPTTNLISFFEEINTEFRTAPRETNAQTESLVQAIPALTTVVKQATDSLQLGGTPPGPSLASLFNAGSETNIYITYDHGRYFLVRSRAQTDALNIPAIERLRQLIGQTQSEVPGVNVGLIGEPVLDYDEMRQSQKDVTLASIVSLILCGMIFIYGYNETGRPLKANLCLIVGLAYTLAFATLTIGHLNILTVTFVPMLIGLAIDFGVHLITRYEEELRHGRTQEVAMNKAMVFTGQGIFTGGLTTAGAFLAMAFTHFRGIQEMGIICGGGLLLCLIPMMTMLPALLLRGRQNIIDQSHLSTREDEARARIENIWLQRPVLVIAVIGVLCALAILASRRVYFDYNLQKLQSVGLPSVVFEEKLFAAAEQSLLYCAVVADSVTNAIDLEKRINGLSTVADMEPPVSLLDDFSRPISPQKLALIRQIKRELAPLKFGVPDLNPVNINALSATLYSLYGYLGAALQEIGDSDPEMARQFVALRNAIEELRKVMLQGNAPDLVQHAQKLAEFQQALFKEMRSTFEVLQHQDDSAPLHLTDLPPALRNQFVGVTGKILLQVYPNIDVWQRDNQEKFIGQLRAVDPDVTGTPVQLYEFEELLKNSYLQAAWYSLAAIALLVLFHFRSISSVILALLPVAIGTLWLLGIMGWTSLPFNPANIMTLPLVIGIGVTNGIHVLNRFAEERTPSILARSTGKAVLVSGLTAIAGFGSLILAKDRGIHSLGCIMSIGIATCMIAGLTFLPAVLNLLGRWRPLIKTNQPSVDNSSPTLGQEEPRSKTSSGRQT